MADIKLTELIEKRKRYIEAADENDFTQGLKNLLTDLYPDEAHFIYELLQNAEDMDATEVYFTLCHDHVEFKHNGKKRNFNLSDIDSITSIGNNPQKKSDHTSIGKFGVGFKAVFAYTDTPEIHSGEYHFIIKEYFLPVVDGVPTVETNGFTMFSFPFNNPKKSPEIACLEIEKGLLDIDENSLLFLNSIKKIEYILPSAESGYVECTGESEIIDIATKRPKDITLSITSWLRFQKPLTPNAFLNLDASVENKRSTSIAFKLIKDDKKKDGYDIAPVSGKVCIYFPAVKETSNLRFHINAPFASTVARDSVRDCEENRQIIHQIADLMTDALIYIKKNGMLTMPFLSVLPIPDDNIPNTYLPIYHKIITIFQTMPYTRVKAGGFNAAKNLLRAPTDISNLLSDSDRERLVRKNKKWSLNPNQQGQREDKFLKSLNMERFSFKAFSEIIINSDCKSKVEEIIDKKDDKWLKSFYALLYKTYDELDYTYSFISGLKNIRIVRSNKNALVKAEDAYIIPVNTPVPSKSVISVKREVYDGKDKTSMAASSFLSEILEIKEYNAQTALMLKLQKYNETGITLNDRYYDDVLEFAQYNRRVDSAFDFSRYKILTYEKDGDVYIASPSNIIMGQPYIESHLPLQSVCFVAGKKLLWDGYFNHYNEKELELFVGFCKNIGLEYKMEVKKCRTTEPPCHPLWREKLYSSRNNNGNGADIDYRIMFLQELMRLESISVNKLIWQAVTSSKNNISMAYYSPNGSAPVKSCESSVVCYLKNSKWIPNKQGVFCSPKEMTKDDLRDDFPYDNQNGFLGEIGFGLNAKLKQAKVTKELEDNNISKDSELAKLLAIMADMDDEEKEQKIKNFREALERDKNNTKKEGLSIHEAIENEGKSTVGTDKDINDDVSPIQKIARREKKIESEFLLGLKTPPIINKRLQYSCFTALPEEKRTIRSFYHGKCQICGTRIIMHNNKPHFLAINIIRTTELEDKYNATLKSGWNTLSLCPNCAAEYRFCGGKDITMLAQQLHEIEVEENNDELIELTILLNGEKRTIKFCPKHLLALQIALNKSTEQEYANA